MCSAPCARAHRWAVVWSFETLTTCTKRNRGEESAAFLPTPPHVHSVTIRSPVRLSPTFARNFDLNLFKGCITRGRFSFLERSCLPARGTRTLPCEPPLLAAPVKFSVTQTTPFFFSSFYIFCLILACFYVSLSLPLRSLALFVLFDRTEPFVSAIGYLV